MVAPRYLVDTNVLSEPTRPSPNPTLIQRLEAHRSKIATASVVWHELFYGLEKLPPSRKREAIGSYLEDLRSSAMPVLAYDDRAAEWHAKERARLEKAGRPLPFRDSQIAAIAKVHGLILVTANVADFQSIADLEVENWMTESNS